MVTEDRYNQELILNEESKNLSNDDLTYLNTNFFNVVEETEKHTERDKKKQRQRQRLGSIMLEREKGTIFTVVYEKIGKNKHCLKSSKYSVFSINGIYESICNHWVTNRLKTRNDRILACHFYQNFKH